MHNFNELQQDALCEIFNISVSQAAASLSEIVRDTVVLSVPKVEICDAGQATQYFGNDYKVCGIAQRFYGEFAGKAVLLFPESRSLELVRLMVGLELPLDELSEMEQDALVEIGNIVINACMASLADMFHQQFDCDIPQIIIGDSQSVLDDYEGNNSLIIMQIKFSISARDLEGHIVFMVNAKSMGSLENSVNEILRQASGG